MKKSKARAANPDEIKMRHAALQMATSPVFCTRHGSPVAYQGGPTGPYQEMTTESALDRAKKFYDWMTT